MAPKKQEKAQASISSFFTKETPVNSSKKRAASPIDLTNSDGDTPVTPPRPTKKLKKGPAADEKRAPQPFPLSTAPVQDKLLSASPVSQRWQYVPSQSQRHIDGDAMDVDVEHVPSEAERLVKQRTRQAFQKKLLANLSSRSSSPPVASGDDDGENGGVEEEDDDSEADGRVKTLHGKYASKAGGQKTSSSKPKTSAKKGKAEVGPSGQTYTPLENQIRKLKKDNSGTILLIEVGYKYRFFGEDAKVASKELGIACFPNRNFLNASIPVHRRNVHVKKLLSQGYRVGIVGQTETAALKKAGDNRNAPFERKVTHLYTAATFVDDLDALDEVDNIGQSNAISLMALTEQLRGGMGVDERVLIGMISVEPSTGDITYDEFEDSHMRTELETRLSHLKPSELLLPHRAMSKHTEKMLAHFAGQSFTKIRIERCNNDLKHSDAFDFLSEFYTQKGKAVNIASESFQTGKLMATIVDLPKLVVVALAQTVKHLDAFGLSEIFLRTEFFSKFLSRAHMLLNGNTLANLEIYRNQTSFTEYGSLIWVLDKTKTKFGSRLLRSWVGRPLVDRELLQERVDAVEEIMAGGAPALVTLQELLRKLPDLVKGLCRIQYGKCTPKELASMLLALKDIGSAFKTFDSPETVGLKSPLLNKIIYALPTIKPAVDDLLAAIDIKKARGGEKEDLWLDPSKFQIIEDTKLSIQEAEAKLEEHLRKDVRTLLKKPSLSYTSVSGNDYLIEVTVTEAKTIIPSNWLLISATKKVKRYHSPLIKNKLAEREQLRETLKAEAEKAFLSFLEEINEHYSQLRNVINKIAIADCLISLATVALQDGYTKPVFVDGDCIKIVNGRHPMVEALRSDPYVPSSITLGGEDKRSRIITGPNMGGKSSCVRMTALIALMAQLGSYVPAESVHVSMHDGILTRMGASDELARGRSTFMVEMAETSEILKTATVRTLVILDELGRGTSTFDGMAIADAVLKHLVTNVKCKTLFITHYPIVAAELEQQLPDVANAHMGFVQDMSIDGTTTIQFLYTLKEGMATGSFGIECAKSAGVPSPILQNASTRGSEMKDLVEAKIAMNRLRRAAGLVRLCLSDEPSLANLNALKETMQALKL